MSEKITKDKTHKRRQLLSLIREIWQHIDIRTRLS